MTDPAKRYIPCNTGRRMIKMSCISMAQMMKCLMEGIYSCREIAEETGLHYITVLQYTREMHLAGVLYIKAWEKDSRNKDAIRIYAFGNKPDAKRKTLSMAERSHRRREKIKQMKLLQCMAGAASYAP